MFNREQNDKIYARHQLKSIKLKQFRLVWNWN